LSDKTNSTQVLLSFVKQSHVYR